MRKALLIAVMAAAFAGLAGADHHQATPTPAGHEAMMMDCQAYMQQKQAADTQMKEMDSRLKGLVEKMNSATGQGRVDAMAAVIKQCKTCTLLAVEGTPLADTSNRMPQLTTSLIQHHGA